MGLADWLTRWRRLRKHHALLRRCIRAPGGAPLKELLTFCDSAGLEFHLESADLREAIQNLDWRAEHKWLDALQQERLLRAVQEQLFDDRVGGATSGWRTWLQLHSALRRTVPVSDPAAARALMVAKRNGRLDGLAVEDSTFLLASYQKAYGEILERSGVDDQHLVLPVLLEFTAIATVLGPTEYSSTLLQRMLRQERQRPRALSAFSLPQLFDAPIRGVGSPNGAAVTIYHSTAASTPVRITYAGSTSDKTLNAQMFASLFAAALACDDQRSALSAIGGALYLRTGAGHGHADRNPNPLRAAVGLAGALEPEVTVPSVGMDPAEALELVSELFQRFHDSTGLVTVKHWSAEDADSLEARLSDGLRSGSHTRRLRSDPRHAAGDSVIHVLPLLQRSAGGSVEPVQVHVSYGALDPGRVLGLIRTARQSYMTQLIANGRRREAMARNAFAEQDRHVRRWRALSAKQQDAECAARPFVTINQSYNFELGIITVVEPPEQVPHREYEESRRPALRDSAGEYAEKFASLCTTLEKLNQSGGVADALSFRLLFDSALRNDKVLIADTKFIAEYNEWANHVSPMLWASIREWAQRRGYPLELLASDNVLFNARVSSDGSTIVVEPHILIDLHDFEIILDEPNGLMYALPGGHTPTLSECVVKSDRLAIRDAQSLHDEFCRWIEGRQRIARSRDSEEERLRRQILGDKRLGPLLSLQQAKRLLFRGEAGLAADILERVRRADLGAVYFWLAVAREYEFLRSYRQSAVDTNGLDEAGSRQRFLNAALSVLIRALRPAGAVDPVEALMNQLGREAGGGAVSEALLRGLSLDQMRQTMASALRRNEHLDDGARQLLDQLRARDPAFVAGLTSDNPDIPALESASLELTQKDEEKLKSAAYAIACLDFLALAEQMKTVAKAMPFAGRPTSALKKDVQAIVKRARTLPLGEPPAMEQIEELSGLIGQS